MSDDLCRLTTRRDDRKSPRIWLPFVVIVAGLLTSPRSAWAIDPSEAKSTADWLQVHYKPLASLKAVPAAVLKILLSEIPAGQKLADRGERFNAADVVDARLPRRRFVFGGMSSPFVLVCYEHGGRGLHYHLAVFDVGGEKPQLVFAGRHARRARTIEEVKGLVRQGQLKNEVAERHQEW